MQNGNGRPFAHREIPLSYPVAFLRLTVFASFSAPRPIIHAPLSPLPAFLLSFYGQPGIFSFMLEYKRLLQILFGVDI